MIDILYDCDNEDNLIDTLTDSVKIESQDAPRNQMYFSSGSTDASEAKQTKLEQVNTHVPTAPCPIKIDQNIKTLKPTKVRINSIKNQQVSESVSVSGVSGVGSSNMLSPQMQPYPIESSDAPRNQMYFNDVSTDASEDKQTNLKQANTHVPTAPCLIKINQNIKILEPAKSNNMERVINQQGINPIRNQQVSKFSRNITQTKSQLTQLEISKYLTQVKLELVEQAIQI